VYKECSAEQISSDHHAAGGLVFVAVAYAPVHRDVVDKLRLLDQSDESGGLSAEDNQFPADVLESQLQLLPVLLSWEEISNRVHFDVPRLPHVAAKAPIGGVLFERANASYV